MQLALSCFRLKQSCCGVQMAAYALGQLLPEEQRPFPLDQIHINDTRSDIVPNVGVVSLPCHLSCCIFIHAMLKHCKLCAPLLADMSVLSTVYAEL